MLDEDITPVQTNPSIWSNHGITEVALRVDQDDHFTFVDGSWWESVPNVNGSAVFDELREGRVFGRCIPNASLRELFRMFLKHARSGRSVSFEYRGDTPDARRWFRMEIESPDGRMVEFRTRVVRSESREVEVSVKEGADRPDRFVRVCSWCQNVAVPPDAWLPVEVAMELLGVMSGEELPQVTHSICPKCQLKAFNNLHPRRLTKSASGE